MITFWEWLEALSEERQKSVRPEKLRDYDLALRRHLIQMAKRIEDPAVRSKFMTLIDSPHLDSGEPGQDFADYVLGTLIRHRVQKKFVSS